MNPNSIPKRISSWVLYCIASILMAGTAFGQFTVTQTGAITINDNASATPIPSQIGISNVVGTIEKVTVRLTGVTHGYPDDIDIVLRAPNGEEVLLMSDSGGQFDINAVELTFSQSASGSLPNDTQIVTGTYLPSNFDLSVDDNFDGGSPVPPYGTSLDIFNGDSANGNWGLFVRDDNVVDAGSILNWSLTLWTLPVVTITNLTPTLVEDSGAANIVVSVADTDTPPASLIFGATSSDTNLVAASGLEFIGTGTNRTLRITTVANANGAVNIEVRVGDGLATITNTIVLTVTPVNDRPVVALSTGQTALLQSGITTNIAVQVTDIDSNPNSLTLSALSSNPAIVAPSNVFFTGTDTNRTMRISPAGSATGTATVTVVVSDGDKTNTASINVTINGVPQVVAANTGTITINDNATATPYSSDITVANVSGLVGRVTVTLLDFEHANPDQVGILLVSPSGAASVLMRGAGGNTAVTDRRIVFDEVVGTVDIPDGGPINDPFGNATYLPADYGTGNFPTGAPAAGGGGYPNTLAAFAGTNPNGVWKLFVFDSGAGSAGQITGGWVLNIFPAPTIATIANRTVDEDTQNISVTFAVADQDGSVTNVTAISSDTGVVTVASDDVSGSTGTVVLNTVTNVFGVATITVIAQDSSGFTATNTFTVTVNAVNDLPQQSVISKQITRAGQIVGPVTFQVSDVEDGPGPLTITAGSNNPKLLPTGSIILGGSGANRTITIFPAGNQAGQADISVTVRDTAGGTSTQLFDLTVEEAANPLFENNTNIDVVDNAPASPYPSTITVGGLIGQIAEVQVTLFGITHPNPDDIDIMLVGPTGAAITLMSDAGGDTSNPVANVTLSFRDSGSGPLPDSTQIASGIFQPTEYPGGTDFPVAGSPTPGAGGLSVFNGTAPNGQWRLYVVDDTAGPRGGVIAGGWQLSLRTRPDVASIPDQTTPEDVQKRVSVIIGDAQPGVNLTISTPWSGVPDVIKTIVPSRSGNTLTLTITPEDNASGTNQVTVQVTDPNGATDSSIFNFIVTPVDDQPIISEVTDKSTPAATPISVNFDVSDAETAVASIITTATSSDTALVPNGNVTVSGTGTTRTLNILPAGVLTGETTITITATDTTGQKSSRGFKLTVTRNVSFANSDPITINDATTSSPYPSVINVSGVQGAISRVLVTLVGFSHTFPDDVDILLVAPDGRKVMLMSDAGGGFPGVSNLRLTFQSGATVIPDGGTLATGTYAPQDYDDPSEETLPNPAPARPYSEDLASLNGVSPNGQWRLFVQDDTFSELGAISAGWILVLETGPTITQIAHQTTTEDVPLILPFSVSDQDTVATNLTVTVSLNDSAEPGLILGSTNLFITGTGNDRTLTVKPALDRFSPTSTDTNLITLTVTDGTSSAATSFGVLVTKINDAPIFLNITGNTNNFTTNEDSAVTITIDVTDVDSTITNLAHASAVSQTPGIVGTNIVITAGPDSTPGNIVDFNVRVTPEANQIGTATIALTVSDLDASGARSSTTNINFTFNAVNDVPTIGTGSLTNRSVVAEGTTPVLEFSVGDVETPARNLTVTVTSSNQGVLPTNNIVLGGSGGTRTIQLTALNATGNSDIAITVTDGTASVTHTFNVAVTAAPGFVFTSSGAITIRDNNTAQPYQNTINVTGMRGPVNRVSVTLDGLGHTAPDDLDVLLVHRPSGKKVLLMSDAGGRNPVANIRLRFDQTGRGLTDDSPIISGTYQPSNFEAEQDVFPSPAPVGPYAGALSEFNGIAANGEWDLFVLDDFANDSGTIAFGWSIIIETAPTITMTDPTGGASENWSEDGSGLITFTIDDMVTPPANLNLSFSSSNPTLLPTGNLVVDRTGGANIVVTLNSAPNQSGTNNLSITVSRTDGASSTVVVPNSVSAVNDIPTISRVTPKSTVEDTPITFEILVQDVDHPLSSLWLEATSGTPGLISNTNILINGSTNFLKGLPDTLLTITLVPNNDQIGTSLITLTASETNTNPVSVSFTLTVTDRNDPPSITAIPTQATPAGTTTTNIAFSVGDPEGATLTITASSSDQSLVKDSDIVVNIPSGTPGTRTVRVTTQPGVQGSATITLRVKDPGNNEVSTTFTVNVRPTRERVYTNSRLITIKDNAPAEDYPSVISVSGLVGNVSRVTVTLDGFAHTFPDDVDVLLVSPTGQKITILSDVGGDPDATNLVFRLDDSAADSLPDNGPLASGTFKPTSVDGSSDAFASPAPASPYGTTLGAFNGASPNGDWKLYIIDDTPSDSGKIERGWAIGITTAPQILNLTDVTVQEDNQAVVNFSIAEEAFASTDFTFTASSTNTALVPSSTNNIVFSGSGTDRTVTVIPVANATGTTEITVNVSNADGQTVTDKFLATFTPVNDRPIISVVPDLTLTAGGLVTITNFNYDDAETDKKNLVISVTTSDSAVVPASNVIIIGNDLSVVSSGNASGKAQVTIQITDGDGASTSTTFNVTVTPAQNPLFANTTGITINDNAAAQPYPSVIDVRGVSGTVVKVTATLTDMRHPFPDDVDILLVGPNGLGVVLMSDAGAGGNTNLALRSARLTFDDGAAGSVPDNTEIAEIFSYKPTNYEGGDAFPSPAPAGPYIATLSAAFQGIDPNGTWSLYIKDDAQPDAGSIGGVLLNIQTTAPTISQIANQTVEEDTPKSVSFRIEDGDTASTNLIVTTSIDASPVTSLEVTGTGNDRTLVITPLANRFGIDTITVTVSDGANSASTTFDAIVVPVNDPPVITGLADSSTPSNVPLDVQFVIADNETDAASLSVNASISDPAVGSVSLTGIGALQTLRFIPAGVPGVSATISIVVSDGETSTTGTFLISVAERLGPIVSNLIDRTGNEDGLLLIDFTVFSAVPDSLTVSAVASDTNLVSSVIVLGTGTNRTLQINLAANAFGSATIEVTATDLYGTDSEDFVLTVPNSPDAPVLGSISDQVTPEDVAVVIPLVVSDIDTDIGSLVFSSSVSNPGLVPNVSFVNDGTNVVATVNLGANQSGVAAVSITVTDGSGVAVSTFALTVTPVEDLPTLASIANLSVGEDLPVSVPLVVSDPDSPATALTYAGSTSNTGLVSAITFDTSGASPVANIALVPNATGTANVTISVGDGLGTVSETFVLTVRNTDDDAPTIGAISDQTTGEDTPLVVTLNVADPDTPLNNLTFFTATLGTTLIRDISFEVTPESTVKMTVSTFAGATGTDRITVSVSDGTSVMRTSFNLNVIDVDKPPVLAQINDQTTVEDVSVNITLDVTDQDTAVNLLTFAGTSSNPNLVGSVSFSTSGTTVTARLNLVTNANGVADITITASDASTPVSRTFRLTVVGIPDGPTLGPITDRTVQMGTSPVNISLDASDPDTALNQLTFLGASAGTNIVESVSFNVTETSVVASLTLVVGAVGTDRVTISVSDGDTTVRQSFNVTVTAANTRATLTFGRAGNNLNIGVAGAVGVTYVIEGTADFITWTQVGTVVIDADGVGDFQVPLAGSYRYFRARVQ